jgi:hypothetical protein
MNPLLVDGEHTFEVRLVMPDRTLSEPAERIVATVNGNQVEINGPKWTGRGFVGDDRMYAGIADITGGNGRKAIHIACWESEQRGIRVKCRHDIGTIDTLYWRPVNPAEGEGQHAAV